MEDIKLDELTHEVAIVQKQDGSRTYWDFDIGDNSALIPLLMDFIKMRDENGKLIIGDLMSSGVLTEDRKAVVNDFSRG